MKILSSFQTRQVAKFSTSYLYIIDNGFFSLYCYFKLHYSKKTSLNSYMIWRITWQILGVIENQRHHTLCRVDCLSNKNLGYKRGFFFFYKTIFLLWTCFVRIKNSITSFVPTNIAFEIYVCQYMYYSWELVPNSNATNPNNKCLWHKIRKITISVIVK